MLTNGQCPQTTSDTTPAVSDSTEEIYDLDGDIDVATGHFGGGGSIALLQNAGGTFSVSTLASGFSHPTNVALANLDGANGLDLAIAHYVTPSGVAVRLNAGAFSFPSQTDYATGISSTFVATGDLNGDGKIDLAVSNQTTNNVSVLFNNGTGGFGSPTQLGVGAGPFTVRLADLDGDNDLDVVTSNFNSASVSVVKNLGSGTFGAATTISVGNDPQRCDLGDVDGDGSIDIAVANIASNSVSILLNSGTGTFTRTDIATGPNPRDIVVRDFDGDGDNDFAVTIPSLSQVQVFVNTSAPPPADQQVEDLISTIEQIAALSGTLSANDVQSLTGMLDAALDYIQSGNTTQAINKLENPITNKINALVNSHRLSGAEGEAILDAIDAIIDQLN